MSELPNTSETTAVALRRAFDAAFANPPRGETGERVGLMAIRVAGTPYALRIADIAELMHGRTVVPVPSSLGDLRGIAGLRGALLPVFGLSTLLGHERRGDDDDPWMAVCGHGDALAFSFSEFEGYRSVVASELVSGGATLLHGHVHEVVHLPEGARSVVHVPGLVESIKTRVGRLAPAKEK